MTLRQLSEILDPDERLEAFVAGEGTDLVIYGGGDVPAEAVPYLDWKCRGLCSASLDSIGVEVYQPKPEDCGGA